MDRRSHGGNYGNKTNNLYEQQPLGSREKIDKEISFAAVGYNVFSTCGLIQRFQIRKCRKTKQAWPTTVNANNRTVMPQISKFKV